MIDKKFYGLADKAWQMMAGCDPHMLCAPRCWARRSVARIVECQKPVNPERANFYQVAITPDGQQWSGEAFLDRAHLKDPLKWRKPALIASGFHGDWARLSIEDIEQILRVACSALDRGHRFMFLSKQPESLAAKLPPAMYRIFGPHWNPPPACTIGCSVMNQTEADRQHGAMKQLSDAGWATHVWYEPAIGLVNWRGWEFISQLIVGGESGRSARPFVDNWAYVALDWCQHNSIAFWMKQAGNNFVNSTGQSRQSMFLKGDHKGKELASLPEGLRVREMPNGACEVKRAYERDMEEDPYA